MRISDWSSDVCSSDLVGEGDVALEPLTGGVSCDVWKVETLSGPIVVKRPLPQLRVAAEWLAPVERGTSEVRWLRRARGVDPAIRSEEHTSELQSLMRISYAVFCLKKKKKHNRHTKSYQHTQ